MKSVDKIKSTLQYKKHSALICINSKLTTNQIKAFDWLMYLSYHILKRKDVQVFQIPISLFKKLLKCEYLANEKQGSVESRTVKDNILKPLQSTSIEYNVLGKDKKGKWGIFSPLSWVELEDDLITWELPNILKNVVKTSYPSIFSSIDLLVLKNLKYRSSVGVYNVLLDYQKFGGTPWMTLDEYRRLVQSSNLDIKDENKLDHYNSVILNSTKDKVKEELLEKAGMCLTYKFKKEDRSGRGRRRIKKVRITFTWDKDKVNELQSFYRQERLEFLRTIFEFIEMNYGKSNQIDLVKRKQLDHKHPDDNYTEDGMFLGGLEFSE